MNDQNWFIAKLFMVGLTLIFVFFGIKACYDAERQREVEKLVEEYAEIVEELYP